MLVLRYRQKQKFYETMLTTVDTGNPGHQKFYEESLEQYKESMFPYITKVAADEKDRTRRLLETAFMRGPVVIRDGTLHEAE